MPQTGRKDPAWSGAIGAEREGDITSARTQVVGEGQFVYDKGILGEDMKT